MKKKTQKVLSRLMTAGKVQRKNVKRSLKERQNVALREYSDKQHQPQLRAVLVDLIHDIGNCYSGEWGYVLDSTIFYDFCH